MFISNKISFHLAILYLVLPFLIFIGGWTKPYIAIPVILLVLFCTWKACKDSPEMWLPEWKRDNIVKALFVIGVLAVWVYYSGIGKFVFQNMDHTARNSIFNILVEYDWPVRNHKILSIFEGTSGETGLIYYIGFWLPSAVIGKLFGLRIGYYMQAVWALLGLVLIYYLICCRYKQIKIWPVFILIFFSGLDIVGAYLTNMDYVNAVNPWHLEWWGNPYQFSSMTTQLFWVFNQALPVWLATMMIYMQKNNRNRVFLLACSMLTSTLPFIGLLPITVFLCLLRKENSLGNTVQTRGQYFKELMKETCTIQNVLGGGLIGILSFCYLSGNLSGAHVMESNTLGPDFDNSLAKYVLFILLDLGIYVILLYHYQKDNLFYYLVIGCLLIIPWIKVGYSGDFCMRASIPGLFLIMIWVMDAVQKAWKEKSYVLFLALILTLGIGSITPIFEMRRTFTETFQRINAGEIVYADDDDETVLLNSPNFSGDVEQSFFYKYLAK